MVLWRMRLGLSQYIVVAHINRLIATRELGLIHLYLVARIFKNTVIVTLKVFVHLDRLGVMFDPACHSPTDLAVDAYKGQ